jgi:uncharacterized membrane protein
MKRSSVTVALYLLLTFLSGAAVGGFGTWLYNSRTVNASSRRFSPEEFRKKYITELDSRLHLTDEQKARLNTILDATRVLYKEVTDKHRPEYEAIFQHQNAQIASMLNSEQQSEFQKFNQEREERKRRHKH